MSVRLQRLLDERATAWQTVQEIRERAEREGGRDYTADEDQTYNRGLEDVARLSTAIEAENRHDQLAAVDFGQARASGVPAGRDGDLDTAEGADELASRAFWQWVRSGGEGLNAEERQALVGRQAQATSEMRAAGVATGAAGGYFVPPGFRAQIVDRQKFYGAVQSVAEVITTDTGVALPWPTNDDTANVGAILAENTQVTEQDVTIGQAQIGAYTYTSKLVRVSLQLLQDSIFGMEGFLARKFGQRLGRATNAHFTTGTGSSQPQGIVTGTTLTVTGAAGQTTSVTYDDLIDLEHKIDPAYRVASARYMLHDLSLAKIRKLKDSQNRPLWQPSLQAGVPDNINGRGYVVNNDMPVMAVSAKSILFGDFASAYLVRIVQGIQSMRLTERYADYLQVGFLAFERTDGMVQDANAVAAYVNSAT